MRALSNFALNDIACLAPALNDLPVKGMRITYHKCIVKPYSFSFAIIITNVQLFARSIISTCLLWNFLEQLFLTQIAVVFLPFHNKLKVAFIQSQNYSLHYKTDQSKTLQNPFPINVQSTLKRISTNNGPYIHLNTLNSRSHRHQRSFQRFASPTTELWCITCFNYTKKCYLHLHHWPACSIVCQENHYWCWGYTGAFNFFAAVAPNLPSGRK